MTEREILRSQGLEARFVNELKNRMAIETGIIEGLYNIDRGVTETLIEEGFDAALLPHGQTDRDPQIVIAILKDQREAIDFVFELVKGERPLSASVIKELHQLLTRHQPTTTAMDQFGQLREIELIRGEWKTSSNNPSRPDGSLHEYCPPEQVQSEIEQLLDWYHQYVAIDVAPEILAAWFHHRFAQIHPFQDGNGRIARLLASIVFIKAHWFPLVVLREDRAEYIGALEKADDGDLQPLIKLCAAWQTRAFILALGASHETEATSSRHLNDVLAGLKDKLIGQPAVDTAPGLEEVADLVLRVTREAMEETADTIRTTLSGDLPELEVAVGASTAETSELYRWPRIHLAKSNSFFADFTRGSRWARIVITPGKGSAAEPATILVSCAALGRSQGSLAVTGGLIVRDPETDRPYTTAVCEEPFIATVQDLVSDTNSEDLTSRLTDWINQCVVVALVQWQR